MWRENRQQQRPTCTRERVCELGHSAGRIAGIGPEYYSGLNGIRTGIALAHEDLAWAKAAYDELSAHAEYRQAAPVEAGTPARGREQNLAFWRQARSIISSTALADGEGRC